ncbi:hypothetical protein, partial [[Clostridium] innocuum]|uniref:hypothetical protein n=1 Tax=Clostridium innocuum TaxID=1522 RepID=UPI0022E72685
LKNTVIKDKIKEYTTCVIRYSTKPKQINFILIILYLYKKYKIDTITQIFVTRGMIVSNSFKFIYFIK